MSEAPAMKKLNMIEAINDALDIMMERDPDIVVMGEDVGYFGGVFRATAGLQKKYGRTRVFDTPISECGIIGVAVGRGAYGLRPVPEIQFADYILPDQMALSAFDGVFNRKQADGESFDHYLEQVVSLWDANNVLPGAIKIPE